MHANGLIICTPCYFHDVTEQPVVGVVMAAYNAAPFISEAIRSVVDQEFADFVCYIVDDGSEDGTSDIARSLTADDHRFKVIDQAHGGVSSARNLGVSQLPPTKYLSFPDADDVWHVDALKTLVEAASALGGAGAHALGDQIDAQGRPYRPGSFIEIGRDRFVSKHLRRYAVPLERPSTFESLVHSCTVYPPGLWLLSRSVFELAGGFDSWFQNFEDWDIVVRSSRFGDFAFVNEVIVDYRAHPTQASTNPVSHKYFNSVLAKSLKSALNTPSQRKAVLSAWRTQEWGHAVEHLRRSVKEPKLALKSAPRAGLCLFRCVAGPIKVPTPPDRPAGDATTSWGVAP
jgi:glycosyltransferase involved in cell wall biosynthesis